MKNRYQWSDYFAACSIVVGAALSCLLCFANGDRGASAGVLLVFAMALIGVLGGRSGIRPTVAGQRRNVVENKMAHSTYSSFSLARP